MGAPAIGVFLGAAGLGLNTFAAKREVDAENQALAFNVSVAEQNREIALKNAGYAEMQAQDAEYRGAVAVKQNRQNVEKMIGSQKAAAGASGVTVQSFSDVYADTAQRGMENEIAINRNTAMEAWGNRMEAYNYKKQAGLYGQQAALISGRKRNPWLSAGTTLLTGASNLAASIR